MAEKIDSTIRQIKYEASVKQQYQALGLGLRNFTRKRFNVEGDKIQFRVGSKGTARKKSFATNFIPMNNQITFVTAQLEGWEAGDYTDIFDQTDVNMNLIDEDAAVISAAMNRRDDQIVLDAVNNGVPAENIIAGGSTGFSYLKWTELHEIARFNGIFQAKQMLHILIDAQQERILLNDDKFINGDYLKGSLNTSGTLDGWRYGNTLIHVMPDQSEEGGLDTTTSVGFTRCLAWAEPAVGYGNSKDIVIDIDKNKEKGAWFVVARFKAGAVGIDPKGLFAIECKNT